MSDGPEAPGEAFATRHQPAWMRLLRAFGLASNAKALILAAIGLVLLHAGWSALDHAFSRTNAVPAPWTMGATHAPNAVFGAVLPAHGPWSVLQTAAWRLTEPVRALVGPFVTFFSPQATTVTFLHALGSALWGVLVWATVGGAIARLALLQVAQSRSLNLTGAIRYGVSHLLHLVGAPLCPLLGVVASVLICSVFGLIYRIPGVGDTAAGVLAFVPLLAGLVMTVVLVCLALGWPLMIPAVAAEGQDAFDGLSRAFAYVNQRRGHYLAYVLLAWLAGTLGLVFVDVFASLVVRLTAWGLSFSAPRAAIADLWTGGTTATGAHHFWIGLVGLLAHGWIYSYFWSASAIIYLLLRRDVDGTPLYELAMPEETEPRVNVVDPTETEAAAVTAEG